MLMYYDMRAAALEIRQHRDTQPDKTLAASVHPALCTAGENLMAEHGRAHPECSQAVLLRLSIRLAVLTNAIERILRTVLDWAVTYKRAKWPNEKS